jgi:hypothetical protein
VQDGQQGDPGVGLLKVIGLPVVQERDIHDGPLVCRTVAGLPQHLPGLLREEVSIDARVPLKVSVALNSGDSKELEFVGQCSGAHLRRTGSEDSSV